MSAEPIYSEYAGDPDMEDLLREFVDGLGATCSLLENALRDGDVETIRRIGHQLKGSGGGYGFPALSEAGAELERAVNREGSPAQGTGAAASRLFELCRRVRASQAG